ncbi:MAG: hypothetical protein MUP81_01860 [Dehalococcoidia bacterium]|nr:hypothetical protein [Dehalococcoidia bacterium]
MGKIPKKVQIIADQLQKVEKGKAAAVTNLSASTDSLGIHTVKPVLKAAPAFSGPKGKVQKKKNRKNKKEIIDVAKKEGPDDEEEGLTGYAGLSRRITRGLERIGRGIKWPWDD